MVTELQRLTLIIRTLEQTLRAYQAQAVRLVASEYLDDAYAQLADTIADNAHRQAWYPPNTRQILEDAWQKQ